MGRSSVSDSRRGMLRWTTRTQRAREHKGQFFIGGNDEIKVKCLRLFYSSTYNIRIGRHKNWCCCYRANDIQDEGQGEQIGNK